jgi:hypothetical protein
VNSLQTRNHRPRSSNHEGQKVVDLNTERDRMIKTDHKEDRDKRFTFARSPE